MTPSKTLNQFRQIVFEFHNINTLDKDKREQITSGLKKMSKTHKIVHIHGNNYSGYVSVLEHIIPDSWEVTYIRNDFIGREKNNVDLPLDIDSPCNIDMEEIVIGKW